MVMIYSDSCAADVVWTLVEGLAGNELARWQECRHDCTIAGRYTSSTEDVAVSSRGSAFSGLI